MLREVSAKGKLLAVVCTLVLALGVVAASAAQQPVDAEGVWTLSIEGRRGPITQTLTIKQSGEKISGTLKGQRGEDKLEGTVKGDKIEFTVKRDTPRGEFTQQYKGTVKGDSMKGTLHMFRFDINWTATRKK